MESHSTEEVEATPQEVMLGAASQERLRGTQEGDKEAQVRPRSSRTHPSDHDLSQLITLFHSLCLHVAFTWDVPPIWPGRGWGVSPQVSFLALKEEPEHGLLFSLWTRHASRTKLTCGG